MSSEEEAILREEETVADNIEIFDGEPEFEDAPWLQSDPLGVQDDVTPEVKDA